VLRRASAVAALLVAVAAAAADLPKPDVVCIDDLR